MKIPVMYPWPCSEEFGQFHFVRKDEATLESRDRVFKNVNDIRGDMYGGFYELFYSLDEWFRYKEVPYLMWDMKYADDGSLTREWMQYIKGKGL